MSNPKLLNALSFHSFPNVVVEPGVSSYRSLNFPVERILAALTKAQTEYKMISDDNAWFFIQETAHQGLFKSAEKGQTAFAAYLRDIHHQGLLLGIDQHMDMTSKLKAPGMSLHNAIRAQDSLIRLAEAVGVLNLENPEQGEWGKNIHLDANLVLKQLDERFGFHVTPPEVAPGRRGLLTDRGIFAVRDIMALYTAWRLKCLCDDIENPHVCEIGGGFGKLAYYVKMFGIHKYTIIDLPQINVAQAYLLSALLPDANLVLNGEQNNQPENFIQLLPPPCFDLLEDGSVDILINQDSFVEMSTDVAKNYLSIAMKKVSKFILSVNHEAQREMTPGGHKHGVVRNLVSEVGEFKNIYRMPYWLRNGYVEELWAVPENKT